MRFPPQQQTRDPRDVETPHISISQARLVETCPLQWRFKYVESAPADERPAGINLRIGIALDRATEAWYANHERAFIPGMYDERRRYDVAYEHILALDDGAYRKGADAWSAFVHSAAASWVPAPFGVQRRHEYDLGGLAVIGYSDLIREDGAVVDVKYGGRPTDEAWVRGVIRQLAFYRLSDPALTTEGPGVILRFGGKLQPEVIGVHIGEGDIADVLAWLDAARTDGYDAQYHPARPGAHCGWCPYREASCAPRQVALAAIANSARGRTWV